MKKRKLSTNRKSRVRRERDPIPWKYCMLTVVCGLILVSGFFVAARQHFSSIEYGIENSKLRKELDSLKSEKRLLLLSREMSLSPAAIKKAAVQYGLREMTAQNIEVIDRRNSDEQMTDSIEIKDIKPIKTVLSQPSVEERKPLSINESIEKSKISKPEKNSDIRKTTSLALVDTRNSKSGDRKKNGVDPIAKANRK